MGLLGVLGGSDLCDPAQRLVPGTTLLLNRPRIARFRHFFQLFAKRVEERFAYARKHSYMGFPKNFTYYPNPRYLVYHGRPTEKQLR